MSNYYDEWQLQCKLWIDSINRNKTLGSVMYDFDTLRLTLVPRSAFRADDPHNCMYRQLEPVMTVMRTHHMEHHMSVTVSSTEAPVILITHIHIDFADATAITELALIAEPDMLVLEGGLRTSI